MILAVDVDYREGKAIAAGLLFQNWEDSEPARELIAEILTVAEYEAGQFYKRELPCVMALLQQLEQIPEFIVIDGYVYLDGDQKPGLGKHLYEALEGKSIIIGVAKSRFKDTPAEAEIFRGGSKRALYVTAAGISEAEAKGFIMRMHGEHRIPALLKRVDQLSKQLF
ncbi:endonuclease V [candidate division KSB1 bacterium]|nr:MAG: endonuclease V [candidate division KSB1 bacterium]MBC6948579.1 endonuclease V [candidate division KSB1 bacterium]MCE7942826.1 endonuclease V [Chlorobi bacterium CHB1]MDL1873757.1 endonuclease V [Cytophagia bacterium CHB2]